MDTIDIFQQIENTTPKINDILKTIKSDTEIRFEKNVYYFEKSGCFTGDFFPSNNASGSKNVIFPLLNKNNIIIDGCGSEFIFCDRVFPFIIQNSHNIILKNFTIDFSFPRYAQGIISSSDDNGFTLRLDCEKYHYYTSNGNLIFKTGSDEISTADKKYFIRSTDDPHIPVAYLFAGDSCDSKENLPARILETDAEQTEDGIYFKYRKNSKKIIYPIGCSVFIGNDENRENDVIFAEFSKNIHMDNITIKSGAGMGFIAQLCSDINIRGINIVPKQNESISVTADALHFINCDGKIIIKDSTIIKSIDDAINVHGAYVLVDKIISNNSITIKYGHQEQNNFIPFIKNDKAYLTDGTYIAVKNVHFTEDRSTVTVEFYDDISERLSQDDILENIDRMGTLIFENNTVMGSPHMRLSSKNMTVKNNILALDECDILVNDLFDYWYESGTVQHIEISHNKFLSQNSKHCIKVTSCRKDRLHKSVLISKNTFACSEEKAIKIEYTEKAVLTDNRFKYNEERI